MSFTYLLGKSLTSLLDQAYHVTACHHWSWWSSFDSWYLILSFLECVLTFAQAVLLILKHAMFLRLSNTTKPALNLAGLNYLNADIDLKIQDYLKASFPNHSIEGFASFIMATDIGMLIGAFVIIIISHQYFSFI